jgi:hypothetical protein
MNANDENHRQHGALIYRRWRRLMRVGLSVRSSKFAGDLGPARRWC